jgi:hypothetical protein
MDYFHKEIAYPSLSLSAFPRARTSSNRLDADNILLLLKQHGR